MKIGFFLLFFFVILSLNFVSSAHYLAGFVDDALDGESSNNKVVVAWNPLNGKSDNLTDIVGVNGNSGSPNVYLIDCELFSTPCQSGDEIYLEIVDSGDNYVSDYVSVTVSFAGYDYVENLSLNSPPSPQINFPQNFYVTNSNPLEINCSYFDYDSNSGEISLYGDFFGSYGVIDTLPFSYGNYVLFSESVSEGENYIFSCLGVDGFVSEFSSNYSVSVDFTSPTITSFFSNTSSTCGTEIVKLNCSATDYYGIGEIIFEINSPESSWNVSGNNFSLNDYYASVVLNASGNWSFDCWAKDVAGNFNLGTGFNVTRYSGNSELILSDSEIYFSNSDPYEGEIINVSANISNLGCSSSSAFLVGFYEGNPELGGTQIGENQTLIIPAFSSNISYIEFESEIGKNNFFVKFDLDNSVVEDNETNNIANHSLDIFSWQEFYGNFSSIKVLSTPSFNFSAWENHSLFTGNVFMTDSESSIDWSSLIALGRTTGSLISSNDFLEVDSLLDMQGFNDSVSNVYSSSELEDFVVHNKNISDVSVINSTDSGNFVTGILWDSSDDSDGEFDSIEREDLVFVGKVNREGSGKYGVYDYELRIPARLREYDNSDVSDVYFYYELV